MNLNQLIIAAEIRHNVKETETPYPLTVLLTTPFNKLPLGKRPNKSIGESDDARLCLLLIWRRLLRPGFLGLLIFILNLGSSSLDIENMAIGTPGVSDIISEMKGLSER